MILRPLLSSAFLLMGGLMLGSMLGVDSLVSHIRSNGTIAYFKDSTGSMAGQDEYLAFPLFFILPLLVRIFRSGKRLTLIEILLHIIALGLICIAVTSVGTEALRNTRLYDEDADALDILLFSGKATLVLSLALITDSLVSRFLVPPNPPRS
ncbi:hypothetical protein CEW89_01095 [Celeribacter ethanolicus]|uniref:Uncharacterized protein n=1 Tax=Celeribacter ethanolicus TaxID=1758178 RepID=A0A291G7H1_9RHOB|nr:hypothetical protein [Celeribacter ethanolicus]ATG46289.1 hypothetical protein CEW89_01095 [Celeribacter ethanolicus]